MPYTDYSKRRGSGRPSSFRSNNNFSRGAKRGPKKENILTSRFIKAAIPVQADSFTPEHAFADFELHDLIQRNVIAKGYTAPTPIQDQAIPLGLTGQDVIGIANTGTGKTVAFALPVLHKLMTNPGSRVLIMAPTRELAQQIEDECRTFAKGSGLAGALLIGGTAMGPQLRDLRANPQIVIGTPGRIKDHMERGSLKLGDVDLVVLDEADRMLDMGFIDDIREILSNCARDRQSFFFSATLDNRVKGLVETFMNNPINIYVKTSETSDNVEQDVVRYGSHHEKIEKLHDLLVNTVGMKALVFDDTQRSLERLSQELIERGFRADAIHGGKSQSQRQRSLDSFKRSNITVLVATDVAARGIDVKDITHVINYSTPQSYQDYVHRIGRAGRAGKTGNALTFIER